ncbi:MULTISPECIES: hypothetical protein [unclassified Variovorax]
MKDVVGIIKEVPALVATLQNSPLVVVALITLGAFVVVFMALLTLWKK